MRTISKVVLACVVLPLILIILLFVAIYIITRVLLALLPVLIIIFILYHIHKRYGKAQGETGAFDDAIKAKSEEVRQETKVVMDARGYMRRIDALRAVIKDADIRAKIKAVTDKANDIIDRVRENPKHINDVTTFLDYYLPATVKILERYADIEKNSLASDEAVRLKTRVPGFLDDIYAAFAKQLEALYNDEILDASLDMEALKSALTTDGLLGGNDFKV